MGFSPGSTSSPSQLVTLERAIDNWTVLRQVASVSFDHGSLPESAMPWKRYLLYLVIIVVCVGGTIGAVYFNEQREESYADGEPSGSPGTPQQIPAAKTAWKDSAENQQEANEGFSVVSTEKSLMKLAGKSVGTDWPRFNGANHDNISGESGLLQEWPSEGPKLLWIAKGLGAGYSGVSVVKGVVYTLSNKGPGECMLALDAGTGEKIWCAAFGPATNPSVGPGPRATPTIDGEFAYGLGADGLLVSVSLTDGKIQWRKNILQEFKGNNIAWGICESVLIDGEKLICTPGGKEGTLVALDKRTGEKIWSCVVPEKDAAGYASALVAEIAGVRQCVQFASRGTFGVSSEGEFLWRNDSAANGTANCSSPLVSGDFVFSASGYGQGGALVKLAPKEGGIDATLVYHTDDMKSHHGDMVVKDGLLFGSSDPGILACLDLVSGKVKWQNRSVGKGSVTCADGMLILRSEKGPIALVKAQGSKYEELGRFDQPERSTQDAWTHPVVAADGRLFLRDQDILLCYDLKR